MRFLLLLFCACGSTIQTTGDAGTDSPSPPIEAGDPKVRTLGLNDVTMLVPLPSDPSGVTLLRASDKGSDGTELVTKAMYDGLNNVPMRGLTLLEDVYPLLQIVAVRFDLCDRIMPGTCPDDNGRMRLVLQALRPMTQPVQTFDAGFHAFYTIPKSDFPGLVSELRAMAAIQNVPITTPLQANPALVKSTTGEYATHLKALVVKYGGQSNLTRVTFLAQPDMLSAIHWTFRGVEKNGGSFVDIQIPDINSTLQDATLGGAMSSFDVMPVTDTPKGFALATSETAFAMAPAQSQKDAIAALNAIDNPKLSTPNTVACVTCHISTRVTSPRATVAMADAKSLPNRYTSGAFDLTVPATPDRTLRNLGWIGQTPLLSQRAANESAQAASEMDARFPP
jgi:hypothetical protein